MFGICLYSPSKLENYGTVLRTAFNFGANFICTINNQYKRQKSDTVDSINQIPCFHYKTTQDFLNSYPKNCNLISVELTPGARELNDFCHFKNAIYIFGGEKGSFSVPLELTSQSVNVKLNTNKCLNLGVCAGIVMFHRQLTLNKKNY